MSGGKYITQSKHKANKLLKRQNLITEVVFSSVAILAIIIGNQACAAFLYMILSMLGECY